MVKNILLVLFFSTLVFFLSTSTNTSEYVSKIKDSVNINPLDQEVSLLFVGDVMLSRHIGKLISANGSDFPYRFVLDELKSADISFANLENPVSERGENVGSIYSFRAEPEVLSGLALSGIDVVSLANNHILDWGKDALLDTVFLLEKNKIKSVGAGKSLLDARKSVIVEKNGLNIAFLAYSQFAPRSGKDSLVSYIDKDLIREDIRLSKEGGADLVVVSFHWGDEYETNHNLFQQDIAYETIDSGANMVIGHHPHVIQEIEEYGDGLIAYSLGNFIFDQNFSEDTRRGLILKVVVGKEGIKNYFKQEVLFNKNFQPFVAESI